MSTKAAAVPSSKFIMFFEAVVLFLLRGSTLVRGLKEPMESSYLRSLDNHRGNAIRRIEERIQRSRMKPDPDHKVPYKNHPYDPSSSDRKLQAAGAGNKFQPIRIVFETQALDNAGGSEGAWFKDNILPSMAGFFADTLSVVPVDGPLRVASGTQFCGDPEWSAVPEEHMTTGVADADIILYVSASNSGEFCSGDTLATASACGFDQYDRPTAGAINVCTDKIDVSGANSRTPSHAACQHPKTSVTLTYSFPFPTNLLCSSMSLV